MGPADRAREPDGDRRRRRRRSWRALAAGLVVAGLVAAVVFVLVNSRKDEASQPREAVPTTAAAAPSASTAPAASTTPAPTAPPPAAPTTPAPPVPVTRVASGLEWRRVHDIPTARQQMAAVAADGTVWVLGGLTDNAATAKVEGYDPAIDTWKSGPDLPLALHHEMAVNYNGVLVVLGGWSPVGPNLTGVTSDRVFAASNRAAGWSCLTSIGLERPVRRRWSETTSWSWAGRRAVSWSPRRRCSTGPRGVTWPPSRHPAIIWRRPRMGSLCTPWEDGRCPPTTTRPPSSVTTSTSDSWQKMPDLPTARGVGRGRGGPAPGGHRRREPDGRLDTVESYDLDLGAWVTLPPIKFARHGLAVVDAGTSIYAMGGGTVPSHAQSSAIVEVLDASPGAETGLEWRRVHDIPTARQQMAAVAADGTVWVLGGLTDNAATAKVEGYDPAIDTWKSGPDLPLALHHEMAVNYNGVLVVLGGWSPVGPNLTGVTSDRVFASPTGQLGGVASPQSASSGRCGGGGRKQPRGHGRAGGRSAGHHDGGRSTGPCGATWPPSRHPAIIWRRPRMGSLCTPWEDGRCPPTTTRPPSSVTTSTSDTLAEDA